MKTRKDTEIHLLKKTKWREHKLKEQRKVEGFMKKEEQDTQQRRERNLRLRKQYLKERK